MDQFTITEISITPIKPRNGVVAFVAFVLNHSFFIGDVRIVTRLDDPGNFRLSYPFKILGTTGRKIYTCHPLNSETEQLISEQVIREYLRVMDQGGHRP